MIPARFAANLDWLYPELSYLDRIGAARADGFAQVEMLFAHLEPRAELLARLDGVGVALVNAPSGDWTQGDRGFAALPGREADFRERTLRGFEFAQQVGAPVVHLLSGIAEDSADTRAIWLENLAWAAARAPAGLTLTVEPINRLDMPGYFLHRQAQALELLDMLGSPRVRLQLDLYHCRRAEGGESLSHLNRALDLGLLAHVQVAGTDGRHEPHAAEYAAELALLTERAWPGAVGLEYRSRAGTRAGLAWLG
ncbi:MAG: hydroxypyruvate isomerase [Burkholderiales bacterium]|nr:MAG: hydroxypyruvate isomerase [Burkholderiales bacterium]